MSIFQLKGSASLYWQTLERELGLDTSTVTWELFEEHTFLTEIPF